MGSEAVTEEIIVDAVIEALAEAQERPAAELRAELEVSGEDLPVDSVLIAEILATVEAVFGTRLPLDAELTQSTGSVRDFARRIHHAIKERQNHDA
ncbi:phosphopantetheine-binding protein [Streptomyces aculeolatus]